MALQVKLVEKNYLWEITDDKGDVYGAEQLHDSNTMTYTTDIWKPDGNLLKESNPLYLSILEAIEKSLD